MTLPHSKWFGPKELACHDGTPYPIEWLDRYIRLTSLLDDSRDAWGEIVGVEHAALIVVSGFRTESWNGRLIRESAEKGSHGVASGSKHVKGMAADIRPLRREDVGRLYDTIFKRRHPLLGGIALYPRSGWVHVDTFIENGHLRTWAGS